MKANLKLLLLCGALAATGCSFSAKPLMQMKADGEETSVVAESSSEPFLTDKDENGIPDVIEDYYAKHIRDQYMFGIGLGSLIAFAVTIVGLVASFAKNSSFQNRLEAKAKETAVKQSEYFNEAVKRYDAIISSLKEENERLEKLADKSVEELEKRGIEIKEAAELLAQYKAFNAKVDAVLENQKALAADPDKVKAGIAEIVVRKAEEVLDNGKD